MAKHIGRSAVRMIDVAEKAGVSRMAASAVLMGTGNGRIRVSDETAKAIRRAADALGYRPNPAAQQLAGKRSGVVALVVRDTRNFLTQKVTSELQSKAEEHGLRLMSVRSFPQLDGLERVLQDVDSGWIDGLIYLAHENEPQWEEIGKRFHSRARVLTVLDDPGMPHVSSVISDVRPGAAATIEHLVESGRKKVCLLTEQDESIAIRERIVTYTKTLKAHGLPFSKRDVVVETQGWLLNDPGTYPGFDSLARRIVQKKKADAIVCDSDFTAAGLCRACRRIGIKIPDDVAVVGWGDLQFAQLIDPPLTTVAHDLPALLSAAVDAIQSDAPGTGDKVSVATRFRLGQTS